MNLYINDLEFQGYQGIKNCLYKVKIEIHFSYREKCINTINFNFKTHV